MKRRAGLLLIVLINGACVEGQDPYWLVKDLRVLAVRAEPPELMDSRLPEQIHFDALVADPTSAEPITLSWQFCPLETGKACSNYQQKLDNILTGQSDWLAGIGIGSPGNGGNGNPGGASDPPDSPWSDCALSGASQAAAFSLFTLLSEISEPRYLTDRFRFAADDPFVSDTLTLTTTDYVPWGNTRTADEEPLLRRFDLGFLGDLSAELQACGALPDSVDVVQLPADISDLQLFHFITDPLGAMLDLTPSVVLTARSGDQVLSAQKRINMAFRDPGSPLALFRLFVPDLDFGLRFCSPFAPPEPGCITMPVRNRNQNPVFVDVRVGKGDDARVRPLSILVAEAETPKGPLLLETVTVTAGDAIRILPVFSEQSYESYQNLTIDLETQAVELAAVEEQLSVSWYVTAGKVQDQITYPLLTRSLDTSYQAPSKPPERTAGQVQLWMVARDQRGGMAWQELTILVVP